jgi:uroporphyrinogen decarboxylase
LNSTERMAAVMAGKPADRRAVVPVMSVYGAQLTGCPLEQYYTDAQAYARGQIAVIEAFQPDVVFAPFDFSGIGGAFGSQVHFFANQAPNLRRYAVKSLDELESLVFPDPDSHPQLLFFREAIARIAGACQGRIPVAAPLPPPMDIPALIMGLEPWLEAVLFETGRAQRVLEKVTPFFVRLANGFLEAGASILAIPCTFASPQVVTREMLCNFTRPVLAEAFAQLKGPAVIHHGGAPVVPHLDLLTGLPAVAAFALDHLDDITQARQIVGPEPVLMGGLACPNLPQMTPAQIRHGCQTILEAQRQDPRFVLFTPGPDVPMHTPPENIRAFCQSVQGSGQ